MIELNTAIDDALTSHPGLAHLFVRHHMICVGCAIARFHTISEAAVMYHLDPSQLLTEIQAQLNDLDDQTGSVARDR